MLACSDDDDDAFSQVCSSSVTCDENVCHNTLTTVCLKWVYKICVHVDVYMRTAGNNLQVKLCIYKAT